MWTESVNLTQVQIVINQEIMSQTRQICCSVVARLLLKLQLCKAWRREGQRSIVPWTVTIRYC